MPNTLYLPTPDASGNVTDEQKRAFVTKLASETAKAYARQTAELKAKISDQKVKIENRKSQQIGSLVFAREAAISRGEDVTNIENQIQAIQDNYIETYAKLEEELKALNKSGFVIDEFFEGLNK